MTQPQLPSAMPVGAVLIQPNPPETDYFACRYMKRESRDWVQISGSSASPAIPHDLADLLFTGWTPQTLAEWEASDHDPMG